MCAVLPTGCVLGKQYMLLCLLAVYCVCNVCCSASWLCIEYVMCAVLSAGCVLSM